MQNGSQFQERTLSLLKDLSQAKTSRPLTAKARRTDSNRDSRDEGPRRFGAVKWSSGSSNPPSNVQGLFVSGYYGASSLPTDSAHTSATSSSIRPSSAGMPASTTHWISDSVIVRQNLGYKHTARNEAVYGSIVPTQQHRPNTKRQGTGRRTRGEDNQAEATQKLPSWSSSGKNAASWSRSIREQPQSRQTEAHKASEKPAVQSSSSFKESGEKTSKPIRPVNSSSSAATSTTRVIPKKNQEEREVVISETNGVTVVHRKKEAKLKNPDRLNLDRYDLAAIPIIEKEENLRLLNFQHNQIERISNLTCFRDLVFLDLYDNRLSHIANLEALVGLRVLMLGRNKIQRIENLGALSSLDILDLHSNQIRCLEGLNELKSLRVLNVAANRLERIDSLQGLVSLTELNARRNEIVAVSSFGNASGLKHLFLSNNQLSSLESIRGVFECDGLTELSLDGNHSLPESIGKTTAEYRSALSSRLPHLKILDLVPVTKAERQALSDSQRELEQTSRHLDTRPSTSSSQSSSSSSSERHVGSNNCDIRSDDICPLKRWKQVRDVYLDSARVYAAQSAMVEQIISDKKQQSALLVPGVRFEVDKESESEQCLKIFGDSFEVLENAKTVAPITRIHFQSSTLERIVDVAFPRLAALEKITTIVFSRVHVDSLIDLAVLASRLPLHVVAIRFNFDGITRLQFYRPWLIYHCKHILVVDGVWVSDAEKLFAKKLVEPLLGHRGIPNNKLESPFTSNESLEKKQQALALKQWASKTAQGMTVRIMKAVQEERLFEDQFNALIRENVAKAMAETELGTEHWRAALQEIAGTDS